MFAKKWSCLCGRNSWNSGLRELLNKDITCSICGTEPGTWPKHSKHYECLTKERIHVSTEKKAMPTGSLYEVLHDTPQAHRNVFVIYHGADLDGVCSAALIALSSDDNVVLVPVMHGDVTLPPILDGTTIYMVDFSLDMQIMEDLARRCDFIWIDHHKSALQQAEERSFNPKGLRSTETSACGLTWRYLFGDAEMPAVVDVISKYDSWQSHLPNWEDIKSMLAFLLTLQLTPTSPEWFALFSSDEWTTWKDIMKVLSRHREFMNKRIASQAYETEFMGLKAIVVNARFCSLDTFNDVYNPAKHHICISYWYGRSGKWHLTFYSSRDDVDCSEIAKKLGGGGHKGAAGAVMEELPQSMLSAR